MLKTIATPHQTTFKLLVGLVALLVLALMAVSIYHFGFKQPKINSSTIFNQLTEVSQLETAVYTTQQIIDIKKNADNLVDELLFGDSILLIAQGKVTAGIDLSKIQPGDIVVKNQTATLDLPPAEIFSVFLNEEQTRVYDRSTGLLTKGDTTLESQGRQLAVQQIEQAAKNSDILEQAQQNAQDQLTVLLKSLGLGQVDFK